MKSPIHLGLISLLLANPLFAIAQTNGSVGIGTTNPQPSAALDITSTTKGVLLPRLNEVQMRTIPNAVPGLLVFNTSANHFYGYRSAIGTNSITQATTNNDIAGISQIGQSFTTFDNSALISVTAFVSSNNFMSGQGDVILRLYTGRGTGGTLLATATQYAILPPFTAPPLRLEFDVQAQNIPLVYGQEYTFTMQRTSGDIMRFLSAGDLYPNGTLIPTGAGNYDLQFEIVISKTGEWIPLD